MSLSPTAMIVLTRAAERPDHRLEFHRKLPTAARHKMIDAMLRDGLIVETLGDYRLGDGATLIAAWDSSTDGESRVAAIATAVDALRSHLAPHGSRTTTPRLPRHCTKQEAVLALLTQPNGTTIAQIIGITGWAPHTVRGFLAGSKKKGIKVEALEKVRQVGPNTVGAKGSYTIYRLGSAA